MGKVRNSLRSNTNLSNPFSALHNWQRHMRILVKSRVNDQVKSQVKSQLKSRFKTQVKTRFKSQVKSQVKSSTGLPYFDVLEHCVRGVTEVALRMG